MDGSRYPADLICKSCEALFTVSADEGADDDDDGNAPRLLLCGHIYCTSCLLSIEFDNVIACPECEVETTVPGGGVYALQEDVRIIGLIDASKMSKSKTRQRTETALPDDGDSKSEEQDEPADITKIENMVDEALAQGAENLAQLEHIREILTKGLVGQVRRDKARLETEIAQAADQASRAVQKWADEQLAELAQLDARFLATRVQIFDVEDRIKALETAMQRAREIPRILFLEHYCTVDKLLERLQVPVDGQSIDMKCITRDSGISYVFKSDNQNHEVSLFLRMEGGARRSISKTPTKDRQGGGSTRKSTWHDPEESKRSHTSPGNKPPSPWEPGQASPGSDIGLPLRSNQRARPSPRPKLSQQNSASSLRSPDIIIEEILDETEEHAPPPTGPELASDTQRIGRRKKNHFEKRRSGNQRVVVTHVENPSHFYVRYAAGKRETEALSKKINHFCNRESCWFTASDTVDAGSLVFVKGRKDLWCRATVVEVSLQGRVQAADACPVGRLDSIRVFILDHGYTKVISLQSEGGAAESSLKAVNSHLRKAGNLPIVSLCRFAPQAIRCSFKNLVPYEPTKGWSREAQVEFRNVVGSAVVEMVPMGQDRDCLLVDLRKAPLDRPNDAPISVRDYLVYIEVAKFYYPVTLGRKPLLYYPPVCPERGTELNAVVSHVNSPADFYIQLVDNMESLLLSAKVQECYKDTAAGEDGLSVYCPVVGQAYVAHYGEGSWCRAQVIGLPADRKAKVFYVDFGKEAVVSVGDLRKIKDEFFALPCMALHCRLSGLSPPDGETWPEAATGRFIGLTRDKPVTVVAAGTSESVSDPELLPVHVFESDLNGPVANVAALLVQEELARFSLPPRGPDCKGDASGVRADDSVVWDPPLELRLGREGEDAASGEQEQEQEEEEEEEAELGPLLTLPARFADLKDLKVRVSHVNSPSSFYVRLGQYDGHLRRMSELVKQECARARPRDEAWTAGTHCAAHVAGVWERGRVCSDVASGGDAEVVRCDHGNKVKVPVGDLLPLPPSLVGSFALECTLTDIRPAGGQSSWTATACDLISCYLAGASAIMTIKEGTDERPVPVVLLCSDKGRSVSVADLLVGQGLALRERQPPRSLDIVVHLCISSPSLPPRTDVETPASERRTEGHKTLPPIPTPRTVLSAAKMRTPSYQPPELPCLGHLRINVTAIGEDGLVYVRTQNAESRLQQLEDGIQRQMKTLPRQKPYTWKTVRGCAVIGPDMLWYRGQLLEVLGGQLKVQYVDYGGTEIIPVVHVYPVLLCEDVPQLCMPCRLHHITPVGDRWEWNVLAFMRELLVNRALDVHVTELPSDPRGPLTVQVFLDGLSLSTILRHHERGSVHGPASPQTERLRSPPQGTSTMAPACLDEWDIDTEGLRSPGEPMLGPFMDPVLPQEGERFQVRVKHLLTPNKLFLWRWDETADPKVDGETLSEALSRITEDVDCLSQLADFPQGGPCLAEYSDGKYYRARLIQFTSVEPVSVMVQHVDFGSHDTLPTSQIRQMPAELLAFPLQAIKATVVGFKPPTLSTNEEVLPYSPDWSIKAAMEMLALLHDRVTALVVAREPEFTVLLYNQDGAIHMPLVNSGLAELE
ncbi:RING finger protein 17 [Brachionichthys hirsutus]|uniref:RING finger protein 17 n=1 Tax=Brachionichthys hirsutus TaxID=412623 RepID=UPI003604DCFB